MVKGRRARNDRGSLHSDRPYRWGASVTGVCQCALRAFSMWCRVCTTCTDRSSSEHWLGRSSRPDLGSRCIRRTTRIKPSGLPAGNARPASPPAASAVWFASSRPSPSGGLRPALTSRPTPRASCLRRALQGPTMKSTEQCRHQGRLDKRVLIEAVVRALGPTVKTIS